MLLVPCALIESWHSMWSATAHCCEPPGGGGGGHFPHTIQSTFKELSNLYLIPPVATKSLSVGSLEGRLLVWAGMQMTSYVSCQFSVCCREEIGESHLCAFGVSWLELSVFMANLKVICFFCDMLLCLSCLLTPSVGLDSGALGGRGF